MKRIPLALLPSFTSYSTTRCLLVKITCKGAFEGQVYGFTNLDDTVVYRGVEYSQHYGFTPSAIETASTVNVDNGEILGFMLPGITYEMVRAGLFNGATIECYEVDYMRLWAGHTIVFFGTCGETRYSDNTFTTEIRSLTQGFNQAISQTYSKDYCRARFGDSRCKMPLVWTAGTVDSAWTTDSRRGFNSAGLDAIYKPGVVRWTTGRNAGDEMDVIQSDDGFVRLMLPMPFPIEDGDEFLIRRDCDKSVAMCLDYDNEPNYRLEPLMNLTGDGLYSFTPAKIDNNYGSMIGAVIGAIIGYFVGGQVQAGAQIGGAIGGLILPDTMSGPRLSQAATQTNSTASPIPYGWGLVAMSGNVIEDGPSEEIKKKKKNFLGITTEKSYTYERSFKVGVMEGPIYKFQEIRRGGKTVAYDGTRAELLYKELLAENLIAAREDVFNTINTYPGLDAIYASSGSAMDGLITALIALPDRGGVPDVHRALLLLAFAVPLKRAVALDKINTSGGDGTMKLFYGTEDQVFYPCKNIDTKGLSPAYRGLAYIAYDNYDVTPTGGALDSFEFVINATFPEAFLTSQLYPIEAPERTSIAIELGTANLKALLYETPSDEETAINVQLRTATLRTSRIDYIYEESTGIAIAPATAILREVLVAADQTPEETTITIAPQEATLREALVATVTTEQSSISVTLAEGNLYVP